MKNIIVLGKNGCLASAVVDRLTKKYKKRVVALGSAQCDLTQKTAVRSLSNICDPKSILVFVSGITPERDRSKKSYNLNLAMVKHVREVILARKPKQVIFISTVSVYGDTSAFKSVSEKTTLNPVTDYAKAKLESERLLKEAAKQSKTKLLILRLPRIYGPNDVVSCYGPSAFIRSIKKENRVVLFGDGSERRELIFTDDVARVIEYGIKASTQDVVNVVTGKPQSFKRVVNVLTKVVSTKFNVIQQSRDGEAVDLYFNNKHFQKLFPRFRFTSLKRGLTITSKSFGLSTVRS